MLASPVFEGDLKEAAGVLRRTRWVMEKVGFRGLMWSRDEEFQARKVASDGRCVHTRNEILE